MDSNHSSGYLRGGYFRNRDSYANSNGLNRSHLGLELFYSSKSIVPKGLLTKRVIGVVSILMGYI